MQYDDECILKKGQNGNIHISVSIKNKIFLVNLVYFCQIVIDKTAVLCHNIYERFKEEVRSCSFFLRFLKV